MINDGKPAFRHVRFAKSLPPVLGVGSILKNTVCLAAGNEALVSPDLGNLDTIEAVQAFEAAVAALIGEVGTRPRFVCHDLHPDYFGTRFAMGSGVETVPVQHHHAHVAAVMAEHGRSEPTLGLALDGFGLGPGNEAWGGELLLVDRTGYRRIGHLRPIQQPGGDIAAREPWRMGASVMHALDMDEDIPGYFGKVSGAGLLVQMMAGNVNCPPTSSCGRLFDAAAALSGLVLYAKNEAEAPIALEKEVHRLQEDPEGWEIRDGVLDLLPMMRKMIGKTSEYGAGLFHGTLVAAMTDWVERAVRETGVGEVVFSGGCFFNTHLREGLRKNLENRGVTPLLPQIMTPGDPAVSLGQAWAVGLMMA